MCKVQVQQPSMQRNGMLRQPLIMHRGEYRREGLKPWAVNVGLAVLLHSVLLLAGHIATVLVGSLMFEWILQGGHVVHAPAVTME